MTRLVAVMFSVSTILAACGADKGDISQAPFDTSAEGKEDSVRRPVKGGDLKIGQVATGDFTATRGWIGYEVELASGPVSIDVSGTEKAGGELDTILYVFGPKRANGKYPTTPLAFNDDRDPGSDLGSTIVLDQLTAGRYQIVVSSYDNYFAYPTNVTRGTYTVGVTCGLDGFGACGPAVSDLGGPCWADSDCLSSTGEEAHCEGEITCAPGTECLWVREGACVADYAWVSVMPKNCTNEWSSTAASDDEGAQYGNNTELAQVVKYYAGLGIHVDELGLVVPADPGIRCLSCACARGDKLVIKAPIDDAAKLANEHAYTYIAGGDGSALMTAPQQCSTDFAGIDSVLAWAARLPATLTELGFSYPSAASVSCDACSCPRGDHLLVFPADATSSATLQANGFGDVYVP